MSSKIDRAIQGNLLLPKGFGTTQKTKKLLEASKGEERAVSGFDIEADSITAEPFLLGFSTDERSDFHLLTNEASVIDLHTRYSFRSSINFYYNLQYDFEGMLKLFHKDIAVMLYGATSAYLDETYNALSLDMLKEDPNYKWTYKTTYIPKKAFHVKVQGDKKYSFYDLLQYYQMGLANAAKKYLSTKEDAQKGDFKAEFTSKALFELKSTIEEQIERFQKHILKNDLLTSEQKIKKVFEMKRFFSSFTDAKHYRETLIKYCIQDAVVCRELGHIIVEGVNGFVNTRNFNSSASISEYYFRSNGIGVPKLAPSVFKEFMKPYYGGRFESMKKGYMKGVSIYDIKSAYPAAMANMPILSKTPIIKNSYSLHDEAVYGTYCINVDIPEDYYISPLQIRDSLLYFPNGKFRNYYVDKITLTKLLDDGFDVELIKSMEIFDNQAQPLLYDLIMKLFNIKEDKSNPEVVRLAAKIILNSLYGKFIQLVDDAGLELVKTMLELDCVSPADLFNIANRYYKKVHTMNFKTGKLFAPQYASYITAHTRNFLYSTAQKCGMKNIIGFHTDSIMLKGDDLIKTGHKLGDWELESLKGVHPESLEKIETPVSNADLWFLKTGFYQVSKDGLLKLRARGIGKTDNLLQESFVVKRRMGLRQAVKRRFDDMNIISEQSIDNNMDSDAKRIWDNSITIDDVIEGKSIDSMPRILGNEIEVHSRKAKAVRGPQFSNIEPSLMSNEMEEMFADN